MENTHDYGRCPEKPVRLNSVAAAIIFLNNLVTTEGYHIIYHRSGLNHQYEEIIDHYEIMTSDNRYDDIYVNTYCKTSNWIPPNGYQFEGKPDTMRQQLQERMYPEIPGDEDLIEYDKKYIYKQAMPIGFDPYYAANLLQSMTPLEKVLLNSFGIDERSGNFPASVIHELLTSQYGLTTYTAKKMSPEIRLRITGEN